MWCKLCRVYYTACTYINASVSLVTLFIGRHPTTTQGLGTRKLIADLCQVLNKMYQEITICHSSRTSIILILFAPNFSPDSYCSNVQIVITKSHNRTERDSQDVGRDILISKKLFLEPCGQFPVTNFTSGEIVDFRKTHLYQKKKWRPKWSDVTLIWLKYPASAKNIITKANGRTST